MEDFTIEKCEEKDAEEIREISKATNYFNPDYNKHDEGFTGTVYSADVVKKILGLGHSFKISHNGKILGYIIAVDKKGFFDVYGEDVDEMYKSFFAKGKFPEKIIYGSQAVVLPEYRGRGIARELFAVAREDYKNKGFREFYAEIASHNKGSIKYWELMGFKKVGEKKWKTGIYFKGCDENWIRENYTKLQEMKDKKVDSELLSNLKIYLYKYELD